MYAKNILLLPRNSSPAGAEQKPAERKSSQASKIFAEIVKEQMADLLEAAE